MKSNSTAVLKDLAREINEHDKSRQACEVKGMMHGLKIGQLLVEAKKVVPHGQFRKWCSENTNVSQRMCQIYMTISRDERTIDLITHEYETISHLTFNKAVKLIREKKTREQFAEKIDALWKVHTDSLASINTSLRKAQTIFTNHRLDEEFRDWMIKRHGFSKSTAAAFLEKGEITSEVVLDDLLARPESALQPGVQS